MEIFSLKDLICSFDEKLTKQILVKFIDTMLTLYR